jgi:hypothetical protein
MRTVLGKALQLLGALAVLLALVFGLGLTPSGHGSALWEMLLLAGGLALLLGGAAVCRR